MAVITKPNASSKRALGDAVEHAVEAFLIQQGLTSITRQHFARHGEIDLVMRDGACVVFVEVRYRNTDYFGGGMQSVDARKQSRLIKAASLFLAENASLAKLNCRFDVIAASGNIAQLKIEWVKNAFEVE